MPRPSSSISMTMRSPARDAAIATVAVSGFPAATRACGEFDAVIERVAATTCRKQLEQAINHGFVGLGRSSPRVTSCTFCRGRLRQIAARGAATVRKKPAPPATHAQLKHRAVHLRRPSRSITSRSAAHGAGQILVTSGRLRHAPREMREAVLEANQLAGQIDCSASTRVFGWTRTQRSPHRSIASRNAPPSRRAGHRP